MSFIRVIADYGDSGAFAEVEYALQCALGPTALIGKPTEVEPFNTIHTGFWVQQHGLVSEVVNDTILYVNTAPRAVPTSQALAPLVYGRLCSGVHVLAINSGHTLSWVRGYFTDNQLFEVLYDHAGSQFRSRDAMPVVARAIVTGELFTHEHKHPRLSRQPLDPRQPDVVREPPLGVRVLHRDGFGNLKLSLRASQVRDWPVGSKVAVKGRGPNQVVCEYRRRDPATPGAFQAPGGEWLIGPGSSGHGDWFVEIWRLRVCGDGGGAAENLGGVQPGDEVTLEPLGVAA